MGIIKQDNHKKETLISGSSKLDLAMEFIEDALSEMAQIDADDFPCIKDYMSELKPTLWKLDYISAKLNKEAKKERV